MLKDLDEERYFHFVIGYVEEGFVLWSRARRTGTAVFPILFLFPSHLDA